MMEFLLPVLIIILSHTTFVDLAINPAKENCITFETSEYNERRGCECVVYQSYGLSHGTFKSPNYPAHYARGINCILFSFIGDRNEIVELSFENFDLKQRSMNEVCTDYVKLFLELESPEVSEGTQHSIILCGHYNDLVQKTYYSRGRSLIIEFHSDASSTTNFTGFNGTFRFLDANSKSPIQPDVIVPIFRKEQFQETGQKIIGTMCSYEFVSLQSDKKGQFFSPLYPQNYPPLRHCSYKFSGRSREIVKIVFQYISLYKSNKSNCDTSPDFIIVYNGENSDSQQIRLLCGKSSNTVITSTGPYLYIEFISDKKFQDQGFAATYEFFPEYMSLTSTTLPQNHPFIEVANCNRTIVHRDSSTQKGVIQSQNYMGPYPTSMTCVYEFYAAVGERVQIIFKHMDLYYTNGDGRNATDCNGQDTVNIFVGDKRNPQLIGTHCGKRVPHQYMSHTQWMQVVFRSITQYSDTSISGYEFEYNFRTDYGIRGYQDVNKNCSFSYSGSKSPKGIFTSPNYPGVYPLFTKCVYIFQGRPGEKVLINFTYYDVGYTRGCDDPNDSDYVTFSNFKKGIDKAMQRLCGKYTYRKLTEKSDAAFFRVTFYSKNNFGRGTGFLAHYQFQKDEKLNTTTSKYAINQSSNKSSGASTLLWILAVLRTITLIFPVISLS